MKSADLWSENDHTCSQRVCAYSSELMPVRPATGRARNISVSRWPANLPAEADMQNGDCRFVFKAGAELRVSSGLSQSRTALQQGVSGRQPADVASSGPAGVSWLTSRPQRRDGLDLSSTAAAVLFSKPELSCGAAPASLNHALLSNRCVYGQSALFRITTRFRLTCQTFSVRQMRRTCGLKQMHRPCRSRQIGTKLLYGHL